MLLKIGLAKLREPLVSRVADNPVSCTNQAPPYTNPHSNICATSSEIRAFVSSGTPSRS